jgi:hypothetical protein
VGLPREPLRINARVSAQVATQQCCSKGWWYVFTDVHRGAQRGGDMCSRVRKDMCPKSMICAQGCDVFKGAHKVVL